MLAKLKVSGFPDLCFLVKCPEVVGEGEAERQRGRGRETGKQGGREAGREGRKEGGREGGREEMRNEGMNASIFLLRKCTAKAWQRLPVQRKW